MNVKICGAITAKTPQELELMVRKAEKAEADLLEIRLDFLEDSCDPTWIRDLTNLPLIATNRPQSEGGFYEESEDQRVNLLFKAAEAGFDFVDIELKTEGIERIVEEIGARTIVSFHDFSLTPDVAELNHIFERETKVGAEICKIVTTAKNMRDNLTCLQFVYETSRTDKVVCFCMGRLGIPSRVLSPLLGSYFTYASVELGRESAPGQLTLSKTRAIYELLEA